MKLDWHFSFRTEPRRVADKDGGDVTRSMVIMRWAIVGLAVIGVAAIIIVRVWVR